MSPTNEQRLHSLVQGISTSSRYTDDFSHYHLSVRQKLWSFNYFLQLVTEELRPEFVREDIEADGGLVVPYFTDREGFFCELLV
jgi:hypothetical protein